MAGTLMFPLPLTTDKDLTDKDLNGEGADLGKINEME